jgi:predicted hotdog family 3-hydroxylacyl-ACP dehydratase
MVLVDRLVEVGDNHVVAEVIVRDDGLFSDDDGMVPAWLGLEYMAQTVAAYSGYYRRCRGEPVGLGFLLGTRYYHCSVDRFRCNMVLEVRAEKILDAANDMSVFACKLRGDGGVVAESTLNVLLPRDADGFLAGKGL